MLPRTSRCILGLEDEPQQQMQAGERDAENQAQRRQRRRFSAMWSGAEPLFGRFLEAEQAPPLAAAAAPLVQRNFAPSSCVDLLRSLSAANLSTVERRLRENTLVLISTYLEQDRAAAAGEMRTVPRRRVREPSSESSEESSDSSVASSVQYFSSDE
jgi:hypothetical protein